MLQEDRPGKFQLSTMMKIKTKLMKQTKKKRIKPWNFAEYYQVSENEDEMKVRAHIEYSKGNQAKEKQSESEGSSKESSEEKEANIYPDMKDSPDHILSFYFRNMKKYNKIKVFRSGLEIQQKLIAAIFIAILLFKESHTVVLLYLIYIGYFYFNKQKDVKTLEITATFLLGITLS